MIRSIIAVIVFITVFGGKPIAEVVSKILDRVEAVKEEKEARKAAMERYLSREILDIEH